MLEALVQTYNELIAPLILKGGPIVGVLLILSIVALAVILVKLAQFYMAGIYASQGSLSKAIDPVLYLIRDGKFSEAQSLLKKQRGPLARMVEGGLLAGWQNHRRINEIEEEIGRIGGNQLVAMQSYFRWLEIIGNVAPLLGLLGTVMGMITAFQQLEMAGSKVNPSLLAGGIWEALLTTEVGLMVAIPVVSVLNLLESRLDQYRQRMRDVSARLMSALHSGEQKTNARTDPSTALAAQ